jgi:hypothetical protein
MPVEFKAPEAYLGQDVLWYPDPDARLSPHAAKVTSVGQDTLSLNIFSPTNQAMMLRDGVRHIKDPRARRVEVLDNGVWDHTPQHLEYLELRKLLHDLQGTPKGK